MKIGTVLSIDAPRCNLRFDGYQRQLFGPEVSVWTMLCPRSEWNGTRLYCRKGARPSEVERAAAERLQKTLPLCA